MTRPQSIPDQFAAAKGKQLGEVEIRIKPPGGPASMRSCWLATSEQYTEIIKFVEKITEGNR